MKVYLQVYDYICDKKEFKAFYGVKKEVSCKCIVGNVGARF